MNLSILNIVYFYLILGYFPLYTLAKEGVCSIYGNCGKNSLFGAELPCPVNQKAQAATQDQIDELTQLCGTEWQNNNAICCTSEQINSLKENLRKADSLISSCPACQKNFRNLFCQFTCSPNQSDFIAVTKQSKSLEGNPIVSEVEFSINDEMASNFYESCKNIKFSATNGFAMDLIGGGAKNYKEFLKFLGDEKPLLGGSPFQINFEYDSSHESELNDTVYGCNDEIYRCSCSDCPDICPVLDEVDGGNCKVGILPCFTFSIIFIYSVLIIVFTGFKFYKQSNRKIQLLEGSPFLEPNNSSDLPAIITSRNEVYALNNFFESSFSKLAIYCSTYPATVLSITIVITGLLSSCIYFFGQLEKNPINLWVSSDAEAFQQKITFDTKFGPFYRNEQIYIVSDDNFVLTDDVVNWWFKIEQEIQSLSVDDIVFDDLCFKPTEDSSCVIESFAQYFQDYYLPENWKEVLRDCTTSPVNCLPSFQQPLKKELLFGGYQNEDPLTSKAIVVTFLLNNHKDDNDDAIRWEILLEEYLKNLTPPEGTRISFNTEPSLESELNKSTNTDAKIIVISYFVMFLYASISLGGSFNLLKTRFTLGLSGIIIVLLSVTSSAGLFSLIGIKSTLIIAEVIPFLILAVGVDNIFLITHELKLINFAYPNEDVPFRVSKAVGRMGPSILLSSSSQLLTFSLASLVSMPAVRNFALYSAGAVLFNCVLQLTAFISLLSLDQLRIDQGRLDLFPCFRYRDSVRVDEVSEFLENQNVESENFFDKILESYSPIILRFKKLVIGVFIAWTSISLAVLPKIQFGLDQRIAIPQGSYLIDYYNDVYKYLNVGPPVYFVVQDLDLTRRENQQKVCGKFTTCNEFSLSNILEQERKRSNVSTINDPVASWIDDFLTFLNPELDECCRVKKSDKDQTCSPHAPARQCQACYFDKSWDYTMDGFPEDEDFLKYFNIWINSPSDPCPLGGKAPYSSSIAYDKNGISASVFRTSHTPLRSQDDFIVAYEESLRITNELRNHLKHNDIFAYSPFYIFFVQYTSIIKLTFTLLTIALAIIFLNSTILLGSLRSSLVLIFTVSIILINIGGTMALWNISLNAVSLVNLVICVGLGFEFCVHITRAFIVSDKDSRLNNVNFRAYNAITGVGGAVFGGICTTKFIGVAVLAFTKSKIFEVYYFRMWLSLVLIGSLHALIFLPVMLSAVGGKRYIYSENSTGIADDLANRLNDIE
ncbi:hypothetical protein WICMUC_001758 [Wickerhamomyces mucosus]|uniref:SSD domain-containing protein n=1 Tax=Wickerhamomyces mucosus TaxID=1378264 RepID=A0A9P8PRV6_9ASCO|nr:hypothetical protein WICMUC_001758 [Wickerhamomyces mucosus]